MFPECYLFILLRLELERMKENGVKFEIEALSVHSLSFLSKEYLPSKIHGKEKCLGLFSCIIHCLLSFPNG